MKLKKVKLTPKSIVTLLFAMIVIHCVQDDHNDSNPIDENHPTTLSFQMMHLINKEPIIFDSLRYTNSAGNKYMITDLKYVLSDFIFYDDFDDSLYALDTVYYIDARDSAKSVHAAFNFLAEHYHTFSFIFGLSPQRNKIADMDYNDDIKNFKIADGQGEGLYFMKLEGKFLDSADQLTDFSVHIAQQENSFRYSFKRPIHITIVPGTHFNMILNMHVDNWFINPDQYNFNTFPTAGPLDKTAQSLLKNNGSEDAFTYEQVGLSIEDVHDHDH